MGKGKRRGGAHVRSLWGVSKLLIGYNLMMSLFPNCLHSCLPPIMVSIVLVILKRAPVCLLDYI